MRVDGLADEEARIADDLRDDVVAERQREGEDRAGDDAGQRQREDHVRKVWPGRAPRSAGGLDQARRHPLERRLHRQDHERQPDIEEDEERADVADRQRRPADHREREDRIEQPGQVQLAGEPGEDAFLGEDQLPGVDAHQIARPERQHDAEIEERLPAPARIAGGEIGDREGDDRRGDRDQRRHRDGAEDDVEIGRRKKLGIGRKRRLVDDQAGEIVEPEEALREQRKQRADIDDAEPEERRPEQEREKQPRVAEEEVGETRAAGRPPLLDDAGGRCDRARSSRPPAMCSARGVQDERHPLARLAAPARPRARRR